MTLNFLKGRLGKPGNATFEAIDMGGGSLQVWGASACKGPQQARVHAPVEHRAELWCIGRIR